MTRESRKILLESYKKSMLVHLLAQADKLNVLLTRIHSSMDGSGRGKKVLTLFRSTTFSRSTTWGEQVLEGKNTPAHNPHGVSKPA